MVQLKKIAYCFIFIIIPLNALDIRDITYLEKPICKHPKINFSNTLISTLEDSFMKLSVDDFILELKNYLNSVNSRLKENNASSILEYSELFTDYILQSDNPLEIYSKSMFIFCRALKRIEYIPNPTESLIEKREELVEFCALINEKLPTEFQNFFFQNVQFNNFSRLTLGNLSAGSQKLLPMFLNYHFLTLPKEEQTFHYQEWLPQLSLSKILSIYELLDLNKRNELLTHIFTFSDTSHILLKHFQGLSDKVDCSTLDNLLEIAKAKNSPTLQGLLSYFFSEQNVVNDFSIPLPGRLGAEENLIFSIGDTDLYFHQNIHHLESSLKTLDDVNNSLMIGVEPITNSLATTTYKPCYQKYSEPIAYTINNHPIYFDPYGKEVSTTLLSSYECDFLSNFNSKPLNPQLNLNLCISQFGIPWNSNFIISNKKVIGKDRIPFIQYTLSDWQLSPDVISGLLLEDSKTLDRYIIPLFYRDRYTVTLVSRKATPIEINQKTFANHIELAPIDYKSNKTSGSTKGKNLSLAFSGYLDSETTKSLDAKARRIPTSLIKLEGLEKNYKSSLSFFSDPLLSPIKNSKITFLKSVCGVEIFKIPSKNYLKLATSYRKKLKISKKLVSSFRLVKRGQGLSDIASLNLPFSENATIICINRSILPSGYQHYPLCFNELSRDLPWIHLLHLPDKFTILSSGKRFKRLSLTPIEEILYAKVENSIDVTGKYKQLEKFETELDILVFE